MTRLLMKHLLLAGFLSACTLVAQPKPGTGSIEGHVSNSLTSAPVRNATVNLTAPQIRLVAETDAAGRFEFTGLPPGTYRLSGSRLGFLDHPARRPVLLGVDDHVTGTEIRLPPQGVIAGQILDEDGEPAPGARIWIFKQVYLDGRKQWGGISANASANDAGEYRIPNLRPGRYLLRALSDRPTVNNRYGERGQPDKPQAYYVPTYHPNALTEQAASPVEVGVGAEVRGIDIHLLKVARQPSVHVKGKVIGVPPDSQAIISVGLRRTDGLFYGGNTTARPPGYEFDLSAPPGEYTIHSNVYSGGPEAYGAGSLTVTGDVTGVVVTISPAPEVTGQIRLAESGGKVNLQGVRVALRYSRDFGSHSVLEVQSNAAGKFVFGKSILPGHYAIADVRSIPDGCFLREVRLDGQEISSDDFEILTSGRLELVLSNTAGMITGSVSDADGKPFPISSVTLIPSDGRSRPVKQSVDGSANFKITRVRPGKYKLFAWEEVDEDLWQDPEFRKKYGSRATEITVGSSEVQNAQLRVITAEEMK